VVIDHQKSKKPEAWFLNIDRLDRRYFIKALSCQSFFIYFSYSSLKNKMGGMVK